MPKPNLFHWATSELSQDAFIFWLLNWANCPEDANLHTTAINFINILTNNKLHNIEIISIETYKQKYNIDILCVINGKFAILIEDKTNTKDYPGQLEKYLAILKENHPNYEIFPVYIKTRDQSNFASVNNAGYKLFLRHDFLNLLNSGIQSGVTNAIFVDFYNYLQEIESSIQSFLTLRLSEWNWNSWTGFYMALQKAMPSADANWSYVPQANGGFLGFHWFWDEFKINGVKFHSYLQLEHSKFCFKIRFSSTDNREMVRNTYREKLYAAASSLSIPIKQNGRLGNTMTVAVLDTDFPKTTSTGFLDMVRTIKVIQDVEAMLNTIVLDK